jgi:FkbM family methyltransferase
MGTRLDKFNEINGIATDLRFSLTSRIKLLVGSYLERIGARIRWTPKLVLRIRFKYEGRPVTYHMRCNDLDFQHLGALFVRREYNVPGKPKRILDLGGNAGAADIFFHCCYPDAEIISVEPLPENLELLRMNWASNGIKGRIIAAAASNRSGEARFYVGQVDSSSLVSRPGTGTDFITVNCVTIPEILQQAGWDKIALLKIDIEGGEVDIFRDSKQWASRVSIIVGELHNGYTVVDADCDLGFGFVCSQPFEYPPPGLMKGLLGIRKQDSLRPTSGHSMRSLQVTQLKDAPTEK